MPVPLQWTPYPGDRCLAVYHDGQLYPAQFTAMNLRDKTVTVTYDGYGNTDHVKSHDVAQATESTETQ